MPNPNVDEPRRTQVIEILRERFFPMIPSRFPNMDEETQNKDRLSRALAAFAIQKLANCSDSEAAAAVVDCGADNGIDAIFYQRASGLLCLVQSKLGDAPGRGENNLFISGIKDLLAERYDRFHLERHNSEFSRVQPDVEVALRTTTTKVLACVVYLGNPLGNHVAQDFESLKLSQNEIKNWFDWSDGGLPLVHQWLIDEQSVSHLSVQLTLKQWNFIRSPRRAVYGLVQAAELSILYEQYGNALFAKNIRHFLGRQSVNSDIIKTLKERPAELFYLNNGLTAICSDFDHAPANNKDQATFTLSDFSIVNGAQTVGAIGLAHQDSGISENAKILITVLAVGEDADPQALAVEITQKRNTQNAIQRQDFVALDPNQERLRQELAISEIEYYYRSVAEIPPRGNEYLTLEEATLALACFAGRTPFIVTAKREVSQLYDRNGDYYKALFQDALSGVRLYRQVQLYRYAKSLFEDAELGEQRGERKSFFRHSRYFVLHIWARKNRPMLTRPEIYLSEDEQIGFSASILETAEQVYDVTTTLFATSQKGYLGIFRSLTDSEQLARSVMLRLNQPPVPVDPNPEN